MKKILSAIALLALLPLASAQAATDYPPEQGGAEGGSTASSSATMAAPESTVTTTVVDDPVRPRATPVTTSAFGVAGASFVLDASKSIDDGTIRTFVWRQVSGPRVTLSDVKSSSLSVTPAVAGTYVFELTVTDSIGLSSVAQISTVAVSDAASGTGEAPAAGSASDAGTVTTPPAPQPGAVDVFMEIEGVKGESTKGEVPPLEVTPKPAGLMPDFSILLGGGSSDDEESAEGRQQAADILLRGAQEEGLAAESISLNYEKITTKISTRVKMFGVIPATVTATVEIDAASRVRVRFPWWTFLATGKDAEGLGARVLTALSNVLKTKHDTIKNSIGNVR